MTTDATNTTRGSLTQEEILSLASRARQDGSAVDEMMSALVIENNSREKAERRVEVLERQVNHLEHRLALVLQKMFGRSSEKLDPAQLQMFLDQAAALTVPAMADAPTETVTFERRVKGHGRDSFPAHVKRHDILLEPDAKELHCTVCGKNFCRIREEVTERGHFVPGYWEIKRYIRGVWACKAGCGSVVTAALPPALVEKSRFEPSVPVHTAVAKFADHIPLERQSEMHARLGVEIAPTTLGDGVAALAALHRPTVAQMESEVVAEPHIHVDDTSVVAIIEAPKTDERATPPAQPSKKKIRILARVWAYVALSGKVFYRFTEDRSRDSAGGPADVLAKFTGCLIGDEYAGYDKISRRRGMRQAGCWAHCRRKFKDAFEEDKKRSGRVIAMIGRLFWIEAAVRKRRASGKTFDAEHQLALRQRRSKRQIEKIVAYATSIEREVLPKSGLGTAIGYLIGNRDHLETFLDDPLVPIDNNAAERALRGIAVGRKNYLHFGSLAGGDTAVVLYSLIGSCKALGINPYAYMLDTTKTLLADRDTPREKLTPWAWAAAHPAKLQAEVAATPPGSPTTT
jgi:transposase